MSPEVTITRYIIDVHGDRTRFLMDCPWLAGSPSPLATPDPTEALRFVDPENAQVIVSARLAAYPLACVRKLTGTYTIDTEEA